MTFKYLLSYFLLAIYVSGCAPTQPIQRQEKSTIDHGPYPDNYKDIIKARIISTYYDPYSIRSAFISQPVRGELNHQGWIVCAKFNAKNRMGAYTGIDTMAYLINRGVIIQTQEFGQVCATAEQYRERVFFYSPWPEIEQLR